MAGRLEYQGWRDLNKRWIIMTNKIQMNKLIGHQHNTWYKIAYQFSGNSNLVLKAVF